MTFYYKPYPFFSNLLPFLGAMVFHARVFCTVLSFFLSAKQREADICGSDCAITIGGLTKKENALKTIIRLPSTVNIFLYELLNN